MARVLVNVPSSGTIGEIKASMLTLAQFQAQFGTNWVLADGASAAGTKYATITGNVVLPNCNGMVLRGTGSQTVNGRTKTGPTLGAIQEDQVQGHFHDALTGVSQSIGAAGSPTRRFNAWGSTADVRSDALSASAFGITGLITDSINGTPRAGPETRVNAVGVNYFIKVN